MLRRCRVLLSEFEDKKWWEKIPAPVTYRSQIVANDKKARNNVGAFLWTKSIKTITKDSNRLTNKADRYSYLLKEIDVEKTKEKNEIDIDDVRFEDQRRLWFLCPSCGHSYQNKIAIRIKYKIGCPRCEHKHPSARWGGYHHGTSYQPQLGSSVFIKPGAAVTGGAAGGAGGGGGLKGYGLKKGSAAPAEKKAGSSAMAKGGATSPSVTAPAPTVGGAYSVLLDELDSTENKDFIKQLDATSAFQAKWKCRRCSGSFKATVRSRTGAQRPVDGYCLEPSAVQFCQNCRWAVKMGSIADAIMPSGVGLSGAKTTTGEISLSGFEPKSTGLHYDIYSGVNAKFRKENIKAVVREEGGAAS